MTERSRNFGPGLLRDSRASIFLRRRSAIPSLQGSCGILLGILLLLGIGCAKEPELPPDAPRALLYSRTTEYRHENIGEGTQALQAEARTRGIDLTVTEDPSVFNEENLAQYRAVIFFNTTGDVLDDVQQLAFERYVQAGGGFVGIHSAADTEWKGNLWPWYTRLVGGAFQSHPSTPSNVQSATVLVQEEDHLATRALPTQWVRDDEWYDYQRMNPNVRVLLTVDESTYQGGVTGESHPIAWDHEFDGGRAFYTGLGHTAESFQEAAFLEHVFGGLRWVMGDGRGPPALDYARVRPQDWRLTSEVLARGIGEPIAIAFTPGGEAYLIERDGAVHRWNVQDKKLEFVVGFDAYTRGENGLNGIVFDPDYEENGWVYLYWASQTPDWPQPFYRLARYELREGRLDPTTEKILLEVPIDLGMTTHEAGSMQFDAEGNLWLSTGDDTNPHASGGYSPIDAREGPPIYDARRSAANSKDLRGKILRIRPRTDGGYSIPEGNLFEDPADGLPEIYAMGLRNPYRISFDSQEGTLFWGDVGPDADEDSPTRGPRGYDEINRTGSPGNFGWPFLIGRNRAYAEYDFETEQEGEFFEADAPRNDAPGNDGLKVLPPARPAWIAYAAGDSAGLYDLESGSAESGRTALVGPVFRSSDFPESSQRLPAYYDGKLFIYEFMRDWIKLVSFDPDGAIRKIERFPVDLELVAPIDIKLAPDGTLWVLEYGSTWFSDNQDSRLSRISYFAGDNPPPVSQPKISPQLGGAPLELSLDGSESFDRNPDGRLQHDWFLHLADGTERPLATGVRARAIVEEIGLHEVELRVRDDQGATASKRLSIQVGNDVPELSLRLGGNESFFFEELGPLSYEVEVRDAEDGATADATIPSDRVSVEVEYRSGTPAPGEPLRESLTQAGRVDPVALAMGRYGCMSCHQADRASAGPSLASIGERYAGRDGAVALLAKKIVKGGTGAWGTRAMPAQPHVSQERAEQFATWILFGPDYRPGADPLPLQGEIRFDQHAADTSQWDYLGSVVGGTYRVRATYVDSGGERVGPITRRESRILRFPRLWAAHADRRKRASLHRLSADVSALPGFLATQIPELPENYRLLIAESSGGYAAFAAIDLTGLDRLEVSATALSMFFDGGFLEVRIDGPDGRLLDTIEVESSLLFKQVVADADISGVDGIHDVYLVFRSYDGETGPLFVLTTLEFKRPKKEELG